MSGASTLEDAIDDLPFGWFHIRLLALVAAIMLLDGFDLQVAAFAAPAILKAWALTPAAFGPVAAAALVGVAIGTAAGGALGDRFGRRPLLLASVAWFGLGALASAFSGSITDLTILRFLTGLGLGAVIPNAAALAAECTPQRFRAHAVMVVIIGPPLGGMLGAALAAWLIPAFGWRACMLVGAGLPLILLMGRGRALRESPYHLQKRGDSALQIGEWLVRAGGEARVLAPPAVIERSAQNPLSRDLIRASLGLFLAFLGAMLVLYGYLSWIPVILTTAGASPATAIRASLVFNLCGVVGAVLAAQAIRALGSRIVLVALGGGGLVATGLCASLIGASGASIAAIFAGLGMAGAAIFALQVGLYGLATHVYPAPIRATGVGMAATLGRVGAIAGAFGGGVLIAADLSFYFVALAVGLLIAIVGIFVVDRHSLAIRVPLASDHAPASEAR